MLLQALDLLEQPDLLYRQAEELVWSILNKAFFAKLYIDGEKTTGHDLDEPFDALYT